VSRRRNILFLTNRVPYPPNKGDKIRTYHQLDHLALSHNVYCGCFVDCDEDVPRAKELGWWCKGVIAVRWRKSVAAMQAAAGLVRGRTLTASAYRDDILMEKVKAWGEKVHFDVAVAFSTMMAPYALAVPADRHVLDMCDVDSEKWADYARKLPFPASLLCRREARRLREYERHCLRVFDATMLINRRERRLLDPSECHERLHVVPNGARLARQQDSKALPAEPVVGFLGSMDYRPNVDGICWFVNKVWPAVIREVPPARLLIVGRNPTLRVRRLARKRGVTVTGAVADVREYLDRCRIIVAPLRIARGLQNKVLEAMAVRRPVVATSAVADGLMVQPGHNIVVADEAELFARKVADFCRFDELCRAIGEAGQRCVAMHYCWAQALQDYERTVLGEDRSGAQELPEEGPVVAGRNAVSRAASGLSRATSKPPPQPLVVG
jgi:sugar transferase (PEP-CTERM/EpsH1 system associated)